MRPLLQKVLDEAQSLAPEELAALLGELRTIELIAQGRMQAAIRPANFSRGEEWLTVEEVSERMHKSRDWIYRHSAAWPFTRRAGRTLLFSSTGLDVFLKKSL
jgi:hypothetical protein